MKNTAPLPTHLRPEIPLAAPQNLSFEAVRSLIRSKGLRFADFWFTELSGRPWRVTIPTDTVTEHLFDVGLPLDGQPVGGSWSGVFLLQPHADSCYADPSTSAPTLAMLCDVLDPSTRKPLATEPRHVLRAAQDLVFARLGATVAVGVEPEFFLLDAANRVVSEGVVWDFLRRFGLALGDADIRVDFLRTGPAVGQGRVQMRSGPPLQLADHVMLYRQVASNLARSMGLSATFLPHPIAGRGGSAGMPVHQGLWKDGQNIFHDASGWSLTSALCRQYAGGLILHLPALLAFTAATTNSYRRLIPGVCGPSQALLSTSQRSAACRIPARSTEPGARRIKFSAADATANPYLAIAAVIMAGLDGIDRKIEAPVDGAPAAKIRFPHCLEAALDALNDDRAFLTSSGVFTDALIDAWIENRWKEQVLPVRCEPHFAELQLGNPAASALSDPGAWGALAGIPLN